MSMKAPRLGAYVSGNALLQKSQSFTEWKDTFLASYRHMSIRACSLVSSLTIADGEKVCTYLVAGQPY